MSKRGWYLIGAFPLVFGVLSYICAFSRSAGLWDYFWSCPVVAVLLGVALLVRSRLAITALTIWLFAPVFTVFTRPEFCLQLEQFHHFVTVAALPFVLWHFKEVWSIKGLLLGLASSSTESWKA